MPSIKDATMSNVDMTGYSPSTPSTPQTAPSMADQEPGRNTMIRCPMPPIWQASPDSLRQFYIDNKVPQARILTPIPSSTQGNVTVNETAYGGYSGGGSVVPIVPPTPPTPPSKITLAQAVVKTPQLPPGIQYAGPVSLSQSFQLVSIATGSPCRVQLYGSAQAQAQDYARGLDVPPAAGTAQGIIFDAVLDTSPYQWVFQNATGANTEEPQSAFAYVTVTNLDQTSDFITLTIQYVPLET